MKLTVVALIFTLACNILVCKTQKIVDKCVENPGMKNFDLSKFSGNWMEMKRYDNLYEGDNDVCAIAQYNAVGSEDMMHLEGKLFLGSTPEDVQNKMKQGQASYIMNAQQSKENCDNRIGTFNIQFTHPHNYGNTTLSIADTDYENYAILYNCRPYNRRRGPAGFLEFLWIASKSTKLSAASEEKVASFLDQHDLKQKDLIDVGKSCYG